MKLDGHNPTRSGMPRSDWSERARLHVISCSNAGHARSGGLLAALGLELLREPELRALHRGLGPLAW